MSLLHEIQTSILDEERKLGPILLKLKYIAARLGSSPLEEWVKYEAEGYPPEAEVPKYRILEVHYKGTFSGPFGTGINNAPIPSHLIKEHAGEQWTNYMIRQSVAAIDELTSQANSSENNGQLQINAANLILLMQGNIYEDMACNSISGIISSASLAEIQHLVRARILELTIELEKNIPIAAELTLSPTKNELQVSDQNVVTQITNQVIHGNVTSISNSGDNAFIQVEIVKGDKDAFQHALENGGIPKDDAIELANIVANEDVEDPSQPWGSKAKVWLSSNIGKAASGTWKIGLDVASKLLTEAAMKYYGMK